MARLASMSSRLSSSLVITIGLSAASRPMRRSSGLIRAAIIRRMIRTRDIRRMRTGHRRIRRPAVIHRR